MSSKHLPLLIATGCLCAGSLLAGPASKAFEDAVRMVAETGTVVRATVVTVPDEWFPDPAGSGLLVARQRVRVEECYYEAAGECDGLRLSEITIPVPVAALRGRLGSVTPTRIFTGSTAVTVNTLHEGEELLLFLTRAAAGPDSFRVVPLQHGKRPILRSSDGRERVELVFNRPELLSDEARSRPENQESGSASRRFREAVSLDRLPHLIEQVLAPLPRPPQRGPHHAPR